MASRPPRPVVRDNPLNEALLATSSDIADIILEKQALGLRRRRTEAAEAQTVSQIRQDQAQIEQDQMRTDLKTLPVLASFVEPNTPLGQAEALHPILNRMLDTDVARDPRFRGLKVNQLTGKDALLQGIVEAMERGGEEFFGEDTIGTVQQAVTLAQLDVDAESFDELELKRAKSRQKLQGLQALQVAASEDPQVALNIGRTVQGMDPLVQITNPATGEPVNMTTAAAEQQRQWWEAVVDDNRATKKEFRSMARNFRNDLQEEVGFSIPQSKAMQIQQALFQGDSKQLAALATGQDPDEIPDEEVGAILSNQNLADMARQGNSLAAAVQYGLGGFAGVQGRAKMALTQVPGMGEVAALGHAIDQSFPDVPKEDKKELRKLYSDLVNRIEETSGRQIPIVTQQGGEFTFNPFDLFVRDDRLTFPGSGDRPSAGQAQSVQDAQERGATRDAVPSGGGEADEESQTEGGGQTGSQGGGQALNPKQQKIADLAEDLLTGQRSWGEIVTQEDLSLEEKNMLRGAVRGFGQPTGGGQ